MRWFVPVIPFVVGEGSNDDVASDDLQHEKANDWYGY